VKQENKALLAGKPFGRMKAAPAAEFGFVFADNQG